MIVVYFAMVQNVLFLLTSKFVNKFYSSDSGIMIKSVFFLVMVELCDLLVFIGV